MKFSQDLCEEIVRALRRVMRAVDLHSRDLVRTHGLTSTQALILKELLRSEETPVGNLAQRIALSPATVTDVLNRLEKRGLVVRTRSDVDRRQVLARTTETTARLFGRSPPLLQERFVAKLMELREWERSQLLSSLQRLAAMMDAEGLEAAPVLSSDALSVPAEDTRGADLTPTVQVNEVAAKGSPELDTALDEDPPTSGRRA
jgi:DNA-binding MarR family transcriptional regulator